MAFSVEQELESYLELANRAPLPLAWYSNVDLRSMSSDLAILKRPAYVDPLKGTILHQGLSCSYFLVMTC